MPIAQRMDFGSIERTRTLAPVFEGARNAFIPEHALFSGAIGSCFGGCFRGRVSSALRLRTWGPEVQLEVFAHAGG